MERKFEIDGLGKGLYLENFWTGKKQIFINDVELTKENKNTFSGVVGRNNVILNIKGNFLSGLELSCGGQNITVIEKTKWYEYMFAIIAMVLCIVWGNNIDLVMIVPTIGGAIGGALSGLGFVMTIICSKLTTKPAYKVLVGLAGIAGTFLACYLGALIYLAL